MTAAEDDGFTACLADRAASTPSRAQEVLDDGDLSRDEQFELWAAPDAMLCAVDELDPDQQAEVWAEPFGTTEGEDWTSGLRESQMRAVAQLAQDAARERGEDGAVEAVATLIARSAFAGTEGAELARRVAATAALDAVSGLPGFSDWAGDAAYVQAGPWISYRSHAESEGDGATVAEIDRLDALIAERTARIDA